jgi:hypothetical protein
MEKGFRVAVADALASQSDRIAAVRERARLFFSESLDASAERRQQLLDVLVDLAIAEKADGPTRALAMLSTLNLDGLRLDAFFDAFLEAELSPFCGARTLAWLYGRTGLVIPDDVVQRARESTRPLALALGLLSDAPDVGVAVEKAMSGPVLVERAVFPCLKQVGRKHSSVVEELFRRNLGQGRDSLGADLEVLRGAGAKLRQSSLSESEWGRLSAADPRIVADIWHCLADDVRPDGLVVSFMRQDWSAGSEALVLPTVWKWMKPSQADMLIACFDLDEDGVEDATLAWLVARPLGSVQLRERVLVKHLPRSEFWSLLDLQDRRWPADWKCFSDNQLDRFVEIEPRLVLLLSFARELMARRIQLKEAWCDTLGKMCGGVSKAAHCLYAMHDVTLFVGLDVKPCSREEDGKARDLIFCLGGHWSTRLHLHLPRCVQQVALVTLWALKPRVGTRHVVYMILERALIADPFDGRAVSRPQLHAVIEMLRRHR